MGGAQPLAVTMNDGVALIVDVDQHMLQRRVDHRYLDEIAPALSLLHISEPTRPY